MVATATVAATAAATAADVSAEPRDSGDNVVGVAADADGHDRVDADVDAGDCDGDGGVVVCCACCSECWCGVVVDVAAGVDDAVDAGADSSSCSEPDR